MPKVITREMPIEIESKKLKLPPHETQVVFGDDYLHEKLEIAERIYEYL